MTHRKDILAFSDDIPMPFDHHAAEWALCTMKVKEKVSGGGSQ